MPLAMHAPRFVVPLATALALALPAGASAACPGETAAPTDPVAAAATLCLLNAERAAQGLPAFAASATLDAAARAHAADMVSRRYFAHDSPEGGTLADRVGAAGWFPTGGSWTIGEDIAWGSGTLGTPVRIVAAWMASPGHRANILQPAFTEVGIGVAAGAPRPGVPGTAGTYVADFGGQPGAPAPASAEPPTTPVPAPAPATAAVHRPSKACTRAARRAKTARSAKVRRAAARAARRCAR